MGGPKTICQDVLNLHGLNGLEGPVYETQIRGDGDDLEKTENDIKTKAQTIAIAKGYDVVSPGLKLINPPNQEGEKYLVRQHFEFYRTNF